MRDNIQKTYDVKHTKYMKTNHLKTYYMEIWNI